jgi:uncharacterized phage protein (TIGR02220 family)
MEGWVKIHRCLVNGDIWNCEPFSRGQAWIDLIILANHKESFFYKRGNKIVVNRGQVGRSEVELADRWKWSRTKVRKFLEDLKKEQQIEIVKSRITQVLTIVNYDAYQEKEQQTGQQKDSKKTAKVQQKDIYKNDKNEKNVNNDKEEVKEDIPFFEVFEHFVKVTGKQLRINKSNLKASDKYKKITSRLDAGFTVEDCKKVIDYKNNEWKADKKMCQYIEISTFFAIANFEKYLDAANNTQSDLYQPTKKQFTYELPTFKNEDERFTFFLARYQLYKPYLDNRTCNTTYRDRIFLQKDVEGLVFELELERPELLEIEKPYQNG